MLQEPPIKAASLADVPGQRLAGQTLFRVWRRTAPDGTTRHHPWWFASVPDDPDTGGRFDLPSPMGTLYVATRAVGAVLEALQAHLTALPLAELRTRRIARIQAPDNVPAAARLTSRTLAGRFGITASLWAGSDRTLTQRWAAAFRRDGWWSLYGGLQHDPSGRLRGYALFDLGGDHPPTIGETWTYDSSDLAYDTAIHDELIRYGVNVREPGDLPFTTPPPGR